jgi:hypothetical protein
VTGWRVAGGVVLVGVLAAACSGGDPSTPATQPSPATSATTSSPRSYQPLWPFADADEAADWQRRYRAGGHQPWRLSPDETALAFVRYLGFDEIDQVTSRTVVGGDARIGVGRSANRARVAAAVIHLIRLGAGADAPWVVVGTDDTSPTRGQGAGGSGLTLTTPAYGAAVTSPITVGGRVSGVDESIKIEVRQRSSADPVGRFCCVPAGGERSPWSAKVSFRGAGVLTVVASTGGHVAKVERFAVTAVRAQQ